MDTTDPIRHLTDDSKPNDSPKPPVLRRSEAPKEGGVTIRPEAPLTNVQTIINTMSQTVEVRVMADNFSLNIQVPTELVGSRYVGPGDRVIPALARAVYDIQEALGLERRAYLELTSPTKVISVNGPYGPSSVIISATEATTADGRRFRFPGYLTAAVMSFLGSSRITAPDALLQFISAEARLTEKAVFQAISEEVNQEVNRVADASFLKYIKETMANNPVKEPDDAPQGFQIPPEVLADALIPPKFSTRMQRAQELFDEELEETAMPRLSEIPKPPSDWVSPIRNAIVRTTRLREALIYWARQLRLEIGFATYEDLVVQLSDLGVIGAFEDGVAIYSAGLNPLRIDLPPVTEARSPELPNYRP